MKAWGVDQAMNRVYATPRGPMDILKCLASRMVCIFWCWGEKGRWWGEGKQQFKLLLANLLMDFFKKTLSFMQKEIFLGVNSCISNPWCNALHVVSTLQIFIEWINTKTFYKEIECCREDGLISWSGCCSKRPLRSSRSEMTSLHV